MYSNVNQSAVTVNDISNLQAKIDKVLANLVSTEITAKKNDIA